MKYNQKNDNNKYSAKMKSSLFIIVIAFALFSSGFASQKSPLAGATDVKAFFAEVIFLDI